MMKDKSIYFITRYLKNTAKRTLLIKYFTKHRIFFPELGFLDEKDEVHIILGFCETRLVGNRSVGMCMQSIDKVIHSDTKICLERIHPVGTN